MKKNKQNQEAETTLPIDTNSDEFKNFKAVLLNRSKSRSANEKLAIELLALKFEMEDYLAANEGEIRLTGDFIRLFMKTVGVKQSKLASYVGLDPSNFSKLLGGERPINHDIAIKLGKIFDVRPVLWLSIQNKNELLQLESSDQETYSKYSLEDLIAS